MGKLDGKIALVTGGNSGIGLATAKQFVHEGAYVFITGRRGAELAAAVKEIGRNVTGVQGDSIILSASMVGSKGLPAYSIYSATKAAVRSFARTWTTDLKERRIRVNAVSPGSIDTPASRELLASSEVGEKRKQMVAESVPLGRLGTPDETAKAVVFLASDDSSYITGIELFVDGGFAQV